MKIDLTGKIILVTGASRGIGAAIAKGLSDAGATVVLHYHANKTRAESLLESMNSSCVAIRANLEKVVDCISLFEQVIAKFNRLDCIVNNAGIAISSDINKDDDAWMADWQKTMDVNVSAMALLNKKAVDHFKQNGGGRLINVASRAAFRGDTEDYLAYAASKGAVVALTRSIARAFGKQNIKAFTIAPGFVRTDMAQDFMDAYGEDYALNDIALPKLTEPQDLAPMMVLLASGLADHATGCTIDINAASYVH